MTEDAKLAALRADSKSKIADSKASMAAAGLRDGFVRYSLLEALAGDIGAVTGRTLGLVDKLERSIAALEALLAEVETKHAAELTALRAEVAELRGEVARLKETAPQRALRVVS
jgi:predicted nuclease with TOPRIM domain